MPSSISNSDPVRRRLSPRRRRAGARSEWKAIAVAILAIAILEIGARVRAAHPIWDYLRLRQLPAEAAAMAHQPFPRVAIFGNSLTRNALDMDLFRQCADGSVSAVNAALYGSSITEWYYLFERDFADRPPDVIVLNLSPGAAADPAPASLRIAWLAEEVPPARWPALFRHDLPDVGLRCEFIESTLSVAYAQRWDLRAGFLRAIIPNYLDGLKWQNAVARASADAAAWRAGSRTSTYHLLDRFLDRAREKKVRVVAVALPVREMYPLDDGLIAALDRAGATLLDLRAAPGLSPSDFEPDGWHMNPSGAAIFTRYLAERLPPALHR